MDNTIELWTGDDWVKVKPINERTAILHSISINPEYGYMDMVLYNKEEKELLQVIKKASKTFILSYDIPFFTNESSLGDNWESIKNYFTKNGFYVEKFQDGIFFVSTDLNMDEEDFKEVYDKCPILCYIVTEEAQDVDDGDEDDMDDGGVFHLN